MATRRTLWQRLRPAHSSPLSKPAQLLPIGRSLALVVFLFIGIVGCLLWLNNVRAQILSAARAYVNGEGLYSKGQKDALHYLLRYAHTRAPSDFERFQTALAIPLGDRQARLELERAVPDMQRVYDGFLAGKNHRDDIDSMAILFRRFRNVSFVARAIDAWSQGDNRIMELQQRGEELRRLVISEPVDPARTQEVLQALDVLNDRLTLLEGEFSHALSEGTRWLERRLRQASYAATAVLLLIGTAFSAMILRQIRRADQSLRAQAERWRVTLASIGDAVITTDTEGHITYLNAVAGSLTGWQDKSATGHPLETVFRIINEQTREAAENPAHRVLREGSTVELEYYTVLVANDGTERPVDVTATPIRDEHGHIAGCVLIFRDITRIHELITALTEADRRKDEFLAMLSHELRNPLSAVRNALAIASLDDSRRPRALEIAGRQVEQLGRLIDDLLDVARITQGRITLRKERADLAQIIDRAVESMRSFISERGLRLAVSLPPEPISIEADSARLEQVFVNLLSNAAKYTDTPGDIDVVAEHRGEEALVRIRDTGIGITSEMLPRIWDLFTQADRGLDRTLGGLGIGLTLVRRLVELHGGRTAAYSAGLGKGAELVVILPVLAARSPHVQAVEPTESVPNRHARILVVEDNADAAESLTVLLELLGHHVRMAHDGLTALNQARAGLPDVMLVDIGLPDMDGYEVARRVRRDPDLKHIVLVALTGYGQEEDKQQAMAAGFDYHLVKPVNPDLLHGLVARFGKEDSKKPSTVH